MKKDFKDNKLDNLLLKEAEDFVKPHSTDLPLSNEFKDVILKDAEDFVNSEPGNFKYPGRKKAQFKKSEYL